MKGPTAVCVYPAGDPVVVDDPVEGCTMNSHKLLKCSWTFNAIEVWNSSCHSVDYEQSQVHVLVTRSAIVFHQAKQLARVMDISYPNRAIVSSFPVSSMGGQGERKFDYTSKTSDPIKQNRNEMKAVPPSPFPGPDFLT